MKAMSRGSLLRACEDGGGGPPGRGGTESVPQGGRVRGEGPAKPGKASAPVRRPCQT